MARMTYRSERHASLDRAHPSDRANETRLRVGRHFSVPSTRRPNPTPLQKFFRALVAWL